MQLALTAARVDQKNFGLWLKNWQVGQMLNALVTAQRPGGNLVLRVAGQQITARADIPVQQSTQLLLEVKQLQPQVVLRIVPQPAQGQKGMAPAESATGGLLRLLPPDDGARPGVRNLTGVADTLRTLQATLPGGNSNPAQRLLASLPALADLLSATGLRRAVMTSGAFLEATLARAPAPGGSGARAGVSDVKALLMRVLEQVNAALQRTAGAAVAGRSAFLAEAQRDLEFVLGGITLNQLQSQPGENTALRSWIVDVPFVLGEHVGNMRVRVDRDGTGNDTGEDDGGPRWRVEIELDLPELGALLLTTRLQADSVSVDLAASESRTRDLLMARGGELVAALDAAGLDVPSLQVTPWPLRRSSDTAVPDERGTASRQSWRA